MKPLFLWHAKTVSFSAEKKKWVLEVLVPHNGNIEKSSLCLNSLQKCLRRATFDWPKVAKGQSRRGISISPSLTIHPLKRPSIGERGPKWSPAKRVHLGEEEQGSGPNFRRQAEMEGSGLCDDDGLFFFGSQKPFLFLPEKKKWVLEVLVPHGGNIKRTSPFTL